MREKRYTCGICGKEHIGLDAYLECVTKCGEKLKKEREDEKAKKYLEEVNVALNGVKQAKIYYEQKLKEFKERYPEEYKLNFEGIATNEKNASKTESVEFSYKDDGKGKPKISAKVNGEEIKEKDILSKLESDPDVKFIAELLGIL